MSEGGGEGKGVKGRLFGVENWGGAAFWVKKRWSTESDVRNTKIIGDLGKKEKTKAHERQKQTSVSMPKQARTQALIMRKK